MSIKHCDYCGEELGEVDHWAMHELESCGRSECNKEVGIMMREEAARLRADAADDGYERYR